MAIDQYRFHLGGSACVSLYDGTADYKLEQMVTNAPRSDVEVALQARGLSPDVITTPYTYLFVNTGKNRVLVDTGAGNFFPLRVSFYKVWITPESSRKASIPFSLPTPTPIT